MTRFLYEKSLKDSFCYSLLWSKNLKILDKINLLLEDIIGIYNLWIVSA